MKYSNLCFLLAAIDFGLALMGYNLTFFLGPFSEYSVILMVCVGGIFRVTEKQANFSFSLDEGESLVWSLIRGGLAFGLTSEKLLFSYVTESMIENTATQAGKKFKFPENLETKIHRKDIVSVSAVKSKFREVLCIELVDDTKIYLPIMGKSKDELLSLLVQESKPTLPNEVHHLR